MDVGREDGVDGLGGHVLLDRQALHGVLRWTDPDNLKHDFTFCKRGNPRPASWLMVPRQVIPSS